MTRAELDRRRLALIRGGGASRFLRVGTGYLIGPRLVLTARHVVEASKGTPWAQIDVRVGHPHDADVHRCLASVRWTDPEERDVALLLLDNEVDMPGTIRRPASRPCSPASGCRGRTPSWSGGCSRVATSFSTAASFGTNATCGTPCASTNTSTTSTGPIKLWAKQRRCVPPLIRSRIRRRSST
ncbi:hypothetical protein DMB42_01610 [Nonomuraea sp. WAC 01424]|nr:hypothetical protein DMB42_01610 [Nonomuraea sp. WAC 01424]